MKVYLSGPMTGMPNNNEGMFRTAKAHLQAKGHEVTSPIEFDVADGVDLSRDPTDEEYERYMARDLSAIPGHDAIVFLPGWQRSGGAGREGERAINNNLSMFEWDPETDELSYLKYSTFIRAATTTRTKARVAA
jgi:hypothetical protein